MASFETARRAQADAAARRFTTRVPERAENRAALQSPGGVAKANDAGRVAKRLDRLSRFYAGEDLPSTPDRAVSAEPEEVLLAALDRGHLPARASTFEARESTPGVMLERLINTPDFVDIRYLEGGVAAARAVCRIRIRDRAGRVVGHGTGSLVSPRLLLTNQHVLETAEVAALSAAEFNFQDGLNGQPLQPHLFSFDPNALFVVDAERDFALVALKGGERELAEFGFNPLVEAEGKAVIGEFVTIIQHPRGEKKQVALRENRIVDLPDTFMHYAADTEPGSSGSPVFNDQWEVVALHHASVRSPGAAEFGGFLNEGIRISRILRFLHEIELARDERALVDQLSLERHAVRQAVPLTPMAPAAPQAHPDRLQPDAAVPEPRLSADGAAIRLTVPLEVSVRLAGAAVKSTSDARPEAQSGARIAKAIDIDVALSNRRGYDPDFLGNATLSAPLPLLPAELLAKAAVHSKHVEAGHVLRYHHFSVVMNKERRLAFFTAVNIDGALSRRLPRAKDRWLLDPRVPAENQTGEPVYANNKLDRGHLVRRLDPVWGTSDVDAQLANDDTFFFTNCTPQHEDFNQRQTSWAGLEDYILETADNRDFKVSVFTGPVFASDDDEYRGVKLPREYWKIAIMVKANGELSTTGYLLSQEHLLRGIEAEQEFSYGAYRTYQVQIARLESLTGLSFGSLENTDPLATGLEAATSPREVTSVTQVFL